MRAYVPAGDYPITAGDVFVIHGDQAHGYQDTAELDLVNILFSMEELKLSLLHIAFVAWQPCAVYPGTSFRKRDSFESRLRLTQEQLESIDDILRRWLIEEEKAVPGRQFASLAYFMLIMPDCVAITRIQMKYRLLTRCRAWDVQSDTYRNIMQTKSHWKIWQR